MWKPPWCVCCGTGGRPLAEIDYMQLAGKFLAERVIMSLLCVAAQVADPSSVTPRTLYGVCCYMRELVHRPPAIARGAFTACNAPLSRYMVVAPRCYCLLTHYPFFALHFRVSHG